MKFDDKSRFYLAQQYIQASQNLLNSMSKSGNPHVVTSDYPILEKEYLEEVKNSSHSVMMPTLFCLYQGIELILKGFVGLKNKENSGHKLDVLCRRFSELYEEEHELNALFSEFVFSPRKFIYEYMRHNGITKTDEFYNSLRYPDKKVKGKTTSRHDYFYLKYPANEEFLPQLHDLSEDIGKLLRLSARLFQELEGAQ